MADLAVTNTFQGGASIIASEFNTNFSDVVTYINNRNSGTSKWDILKSAGTLTVDGASTLTGAVTASSTLALSGAATLSSTLAVTGATTLSSTLSAGTSTLTGANIAINTSAGAISHPWLLRNAGTTTSTGVGLILSLDTVDNYKWRIASQATAGAPSAMSPTLRFSVDNAAGTYTDYLTITSGGLATFLGQLVGKGTATNDSASTGYIGEVVESINTSYGNVSGSTQYTDATSISLTAGDWDISGQVVFNFNGVTGSGTHAAAISINSGNTTTDHVIGDNQMHASNPSAITNSFGIGVHYRLSIASTTTVYLKGMATYSGGTPQILGTIRARRAR